MSSFEQELNYLVVIEADASGGNDYWLMLTNLEDGSWSPVLSDYTTNYTKDDDEFPGSHVIADNEVSFTVPLTALGIRRRFGSRRSPRKRTTKLAMLRPRTWRPKGSGSRQPVPG